MIDDGEFFAWLDGELDEKAAGRVAAAVAASPELTRKAEQHRRLAADMRGAFSDVMGGSGPAPRFGSDQVVDFGARATERARRRSWLGVPQWAAMAASLVVGLVIGTQFAERDNSPVSVDDGLLVAAAPLDGELDTRLASAPADGATRIGLTFRDASGRICRSFTDATASGLACREGDGWRIRGLYAAGEGQQGDYRMAASEDPRLAALIDETIAGEPFDEAQEKAALEAGWR
jgi:hypothetical protein